MKYIEIRTDVGSIPHEVNEGQPAEIASWVFLPEHLPEVPIVTVLLNGGSYDKRYWHVEIPVTAPLKHCATRAISW